MRRSYRISSLSQSAVLPDCLVLAIATSMFRKLTSRRLLPRSRLTVSDVSLAIEPYPQCGSQLNMLPRTQQLASAPA